jgi:sugar O-acyltransferase (sialic acid O-acetyltransferase NeuD family)
MKDKIIIVGDGEFAEIAYEYFTFDSTYEVVAFAVEKSYITKKTLFDLPVVEFEEMTTLYSPKEYKVFTAITFTKFNRVRSRLYSECKKKGYEFVSYISSKAFVWRNVEIGENCFIFEGNTLQYNVKIGNNVVLWSGNHIGHRSEIGNNCFLTSHVVVSGYCKVGDNCFMGVNSSLVDTISICPNTLIGAGSVVTRSIEEQGKMYIGSPAKPMKKTVYEHFQIEE